MSIGEPITQFGKQFFKTLKALFGIVLSGVVIAWIGILLHESQHHLTAQFGTFLTHLGFAFIIAVILFGAFEEWAAREHKKSAIAHIYGVKADEKVFDMIEEHVLKQRFYRRRLVVTFAFKEQVGENILVEQSTEYVVKNVCSRYDRSKLELRGVVELKPLQTGDTEWDDDLGLKTLTLIRKRGEEFIREIIPREQIEFTPDPDARTLSYVIKEGIPLPFERSIGVEAIHALVAHDHDATVWTSAFPSTDLEFRVTWEEPIRLKFAFHATHPELGKLTPKPEGPRSLVIPLPQPFLKGHGIHLRWSPAPALDDAAAPAPDLAPASEVGNSR